MAPIYKKRINKNTKEKKLPLAEIELTTPRLSIELIIIIITATPWSRWKLRRWIAYLCRVSVLCNIGRYL